MTDGATVPTTDLAALVGGASRHEGATFDRIQVLSDVPIRAVDFDGMSMAGSDMPEVVFEDCSFTRCRWDENSFRRCRFTRCSFESCFLKETTFVDCVVTATVFRDCHLFETMVRGGSFVDVQVLSSRSESTSFIQSEVVDLSVHDVSIPRNGVAYFRVMPSDDVRSSLIALGSVPTIREV